MARRLRPPRGAVIPLGYALHHHEHGAYLVSCSDGDGIAESVWTDDPRRALLLPTEHAAVMLACVVRVEGVEVAAMIAHRAPRGRPRKAVPMTKAKRMTKTAARAAIRAELARLIARGMDPVALHEVLEDDVSNGALWRRLAKGAAK